MTAPSIPPKIYELAAKVVNENARAFHIVSNEFKEGKHPLPIYYVDCKGKGIIFGWADVIVIRDGEVITMILGEASGRPAIDFVNHGIGSLYYEFKDAANPEEKGPCAVAVDCIVCDGT